jgi:hypothetical protein
MKEQKVIVCPGLGDDNMFLRWELNSWEDAGLAPQLHIAPWKGDEPYKSKIERLIQEIRQLSSTGGKLALVGISAGGTLAFNAYCQEKESISTLVLLAAPIQRSSNWSLLTHLTARNRSFRESLSYAEQNVQTLTEDDKKKILIVRGIFDEQVPTSTTYISGVQQVKIPSVEHNLTLTLALTVFKKPLMGFISEAKT